MIHLHVIQLQQVPFGLSTIQASSILLLLFTVGAVANAGRAMLMRMAGPYFVSSSLILYFNALLGKHLFYVAIVPYSGINSVA